MNHYQLKNFGYIIDTLPRDLFNSISKECKTGEKNNPEFITGLTAKNVAVHRSLVNNKKVLFDYIKNLIEKYDEMWPGLYDVKVMTNDLPFKFCEPWINYQRKGEYIPNHSHDGIYSYSIWVNIPTPSIFEFTYTNIMGNIYQQKINLTNEDEGKIILFPSKLPHIVYPFNDTNKVRMSISGNLNFDSSVATKARSVNRSVYNYE
tara:strand:+ start:60 stop:674 length:615 start_codon:yes stop_codon:yes gene_type:complete